MSDSVRPQRWQPTGLPHPWDSPGKNTGVGCHFLLRCMKVKGESEVAQSCLTLRDPMDCSLPGSSVHGIFQARVLECGAIAFSRYSSSVIALSSCPQYFPASEAFPMSWLFPSGGQSIGALASASREYSGLISFRTDWFDLLAV